MRLAGLSFQGFALTGLRFQGFAFPLLAVDPFEEELGGAFGHVVADLGGWGEGAVDGVDGDFGDGERSVLVVGGAAALEVEAGDLEAVEEEAGAAGVEAAGGDAVEDLAEGELDAGGVR